MLNLAAYHGEATEHVSIKLGEGLCSLAINEDRVVNEADVKGNGKYLACFINTNSELVVPVDTYKCIYVKGTFLVFHIT